MTILPPIVTLPPVLVDDDPAPELEQPAAAVASAAIKVRDFQALPDHPGRGFLGR
jgi:hypothetical protein